MPKLEIEQKLDLMKTVISRPHDAQEMDGTSHIYKEALKLLEQEESDAD